MNFLEMNQDEEKELEENLVWILASPRSGTTWLSKNLLSYNTHILNEFNITKHLGTGATFMGNKKTFMNIQGKRRDYIFSLEYKDTWVYYLRKLVVNRIYSQFNDTSKKVIIKEPAIAGILTVSQIFPNSKIIFIVRDGRDIVDSQLDGRVHGFEKGGRFQGKTFPILNKKNREVFIKNSSENWVRITQEILETHEKHDKNKCYLVKYESLLYDTLTELEKIYDFLNIKISKNDLEKIVNESKFEKIPTELRGKGKFFRAANPGYWKENFNIKEKGLMNSIMRDTLQRLEYAV